MRFTKTKEKGVSIFLALVILVILLVATFGLIDVLLRQKRTTKEVNLSAIALGAANAGIERIFYLDKRCIEDSFFCSNGMCDGKRCCKSDCSGLNSSTTIHGTVDVPNSSESARYSVVFVRNCGINTATSTGSYKGVSKTISTSFGTSAAGPYLNSATGQTCEEFCSSSDCICQSIGTNRDKADNGEVSFYNYMIPYPVCQVQYPPSPCKIPMDPTPPSSPEPCPASHETYPAAWTYCYCTGTSQ